MVFLNLLFHEFTAFQLKLYLSNFNVNLFIDEAVLMLFAYIPISPLWLQFFSHCFYVVTPAPFVRSNARIISSFILFFFPLSTLNLKNYNMSVSHPDYKYSHYKLGISILNYSHFNHAAYLYFMATCLCHWPLGLRPISWLSICISQLQFLTLAPYLYFLTPATALIFKLYFPTMKAFTDLFQVL